MSFGAKLSSMIGAVDLTDLDMWVRGVPHEEFARLRREAPVAWFPDEGSGFWSVTRYADIVAASRDVATFSSGRASRSRSRPTRTWRPGDDLLSRLLRAEVDGDRLSEADL